MHGEVAIDNFLFNFLCIFVNCNDVYLDSVSQFVKVFTREKNSFSFGLLVYF